MGDYFKHWLSLAGRTDRSKLPKIFFVNWFRKSAEGKWLWPGFGDNSRVLKWICERVEGGGKAVKTPIGYLPAEDAIDLSGSKVTAADIKELLRVDTEGWKKEIADIGSNYDKFGARLPAAMRGQLDELKARLG
jgi:phosphoenolpyruvate carboxykinase (GTP)